MFLSQMPPNLSPLTSDQSQQLEALVAGLTPIQQAWISGYLAGNLSAGTGAVVAPVSLGAISAPTKDTTLSVLYGSQTGNAHGVAKVLAGKAEAQGLTVKLTDMADYKPNALKNEDFLVIVVSTYGEGEPPEPAEKLHAFLASKKAPKLNGVKIAVLGLGDSSYEHFCQTAIDFETRLTALGAQVLVEKALFDVDYDDLAAGWIDKAVAAFKPELDALAGAGTASVPLTAGAVTPVAAYDKKNPFPAEISVVQKITGRDSTKDVRHIEISLEGSGLTYQPGDALGIYFLNEEAAVDALLASCKLDGKETVSVGETTKNLRDALIEDFELTQSYPGFVEKYAEATDNEALKTLAQDKAKLRDYIADRQLYDIIREHPADIEATVLIATLRKSQPRLYSIASSQLEMEDEVHLTVGIVEYEAFGQAHLGGASGFLGRRTKEGDKVRVYVEPNDRFRLPSSSDIPVIMVGPGTGIAPFRAFLQEREAIEATGKSWLFFGNPHFTQDFLYQTEMQAYLKSGFLSRMDVAFSRDQAEKVYVQDRLRESGRELFGWLESGAHFYVCGDGNRMAKDVHQALLDIVVEHGGKTTNAAIDYLEDLRSSGRYQKDVY